MRHVGAAWDTISRPKTHATITVSHKAHRHHIGHKLSPRSDSPRPCSYACPSFTMTGWSGLPSPPSPSSVSPPACCLSFHVVGKMRRSNDSNNEMVSFVLVWTFVVVIDGQIVSKERRYAREREAVLSLRRRPTAVYMCKFGAINA